MQRHSKQRINANSRSFLHVPISNSLVFCAENSTTTAVASPAITSASTSLAPALHHPTSLNRASAWDQDSTRNPPTTFVQRPTMVAFICPLPAKSLISLLQACTPQDCPGRCGRQQEEEEEVEEEDLVDQRISKVSQSLTPVSVDKVWMIFLTFSFSFPQWDHWISVYLWTQMRQGSDACRLHLLTRVFVYCIYKQPNIFFILQSNRSQRGEYKGYFVFTSPQGYRSCLVVETRHQLARYPTERDPLTLVGALRARASAQCCLDAQLASLWGAQYRPYEPHLGPYRLVACKRLP